MSNFFGDAKVQLVRGPAQKSVASLADELNDKKYVLLALCGKETPTARAFIPHLRTFYDKFSKDKNFEVIFVSQDRSAAAMSAFMETMHGDWLALDYESAKRIGPQLAAEYKIDFFPALLVCERVPAGRTLVTAVGRDMLIHDEEAERFPWPNGEAELQKYKRGLLINIGICVVIAFGLGYFLMNLSV